MTVQQDTATVEQAADSGSTFDDILRLAGEEPDEPLADEEDEEDVEADLDADLPDEETDEDEADEADEPAEVIKPPVSLNKEQTAAFKQLPPDLQKVWAETEAQRNEQVRVKTTEAAEATRTATSQAQAALAEIQQQYAAELEVYASAFRPEEPDVSLLATDPAAYAQQAHLARQMAAQHDALMQQVNAIRGQADQTLQARQAETVQMEQARLRTEWPDILDPAKQSDLWNGIVETGKALGFAPDLLANSNATEMLALKTASDWKAKADKWDAFQVRKMSNVRAAKELPKVAKPNAAQTRNMSDAQRADAAFKRAKSSKSGDDYAAYFEASGIKL